MTKPSPAVLAVGLFFCLSLHTGGYAEEIKPVSAGAAKGRELPRLESINGRERLNGILILSEQALGDELVQMIHAR